MRVRTAAALAAAAAMLAGCAGVPTSGPVQQGPVVVAPEGDSFIRVIARPPVDGMTQEQVVRGFQEATAAQDIAFDVAKQYLTDLAAATWDPTAGVQVYDNAGLAYELDGDVVKAGGAKAAEIDDAGQWTVAAPGSRLEVRYGLQRVDGEWRISAPPQGLVLGRGDIDRS